MKHIVTVARVTTVSIDIEVETEHGSIEEAKTLALAEAQETDEFDNYDGIVEFEFVQMQGHEERVVTDDRFWDCQCGEHYIHPVSESSCSICGCEEVEMPPSRVNEILDYYGCKPEDLVTPVDVKREVLKKQIIRDVNRDRKWTCVTYIGTKDKPSEKALLGNVVGGDDTHLALLQLQHRGIPGILLKDCILLKNRVYEQYTEWWVVKE